MTPEERFIRMENLMQSLIEGQVQLQAQQTVQEAQIQKNTDAIRDLIIVSRTLVDSHQRTSDEIDKLREAQRATDEKLHALIETVDRIIRNRQ